MGFQDVEWALRTELPRARRKSMFACKAVLVVLCHRADDDTHRTFVGQATIADSLECDRSTVLRSLDTLEGLGIITRQPRNRRNGSQTTDTITINVEWKSEKHAAESNVAQSNVAESNVAENSEQGGGEQHPIEAKASIRSTTGQAAQKRGTRIPDDFTITPSMVAWAREHTPLVDGKRATAMFINYWTSATGRNATKLDWELTWRNWMLKDQQTAERVTAPKSWERSVPIPPREIGADDCPDHPGYPTPCTRCEREHELERIPA